ncbi:MAG: hypothetical protein H6536_03500 [Bacteroidales bacterium]|nr:hypothetical protein [Bacteroidales bacterium]
MSLNIHVQKAKSEGTVPIFILHFIFASISMALVLLLIQLFGGALTWDNYSNYYIVLMPLTIVLPAIIAIATALSYKSVLLTIAPAASVNQERLKNFFFKGAYRVSSQGDGRVVFERAGLIRRFLCLNFDKPYIEVVSGEVRVYMLRRVSHFLIPQLKQGKRFEINPEQHNA